MSNSAPFRPTLREECRRLVLIGMSDEDIYEELNSAGDARVKNNLKQAIGLAHADLDKEGASWSGPWRVAYVKVTGERVFDVGGGHHVGEHSLEAFGFRP